MKMMNLILQNKFHGFPHRNFASMNRKNYYTFFPLVSSY